MNIAKAKELANELKNLLVGETINEIKFSNPEVVGDFYPLKIYTLSGKIILIGPTGNWDRSLIITILNEKDEQIYERDLV